ncbi:MAG TPA: pyrimidine 5'-nucleotidase [Rhodospirillales bacterium]|jgi:putative hydrolase of the HAD superfamily|nr:pyrimidine 5'-nucleotidase [Rhodospirillales bacterium]|tara:strand:+ start:561 stop:1265 length:705 start_codon:yes stop_codon:yes gene_type:complete
MTQSTASPAPPPSRCPGFLKNAEAWVFDLDNTLYPASSNLFAQIDERMRSYIADFLELELSQAERLQKHYFRQYGTTLRGLMNRHGMEPRPFLDHVHAIDLTPVAPDPVLAAALARLRGRKLIFTNATADHAERVVARLGVGHHFDAVFDIAAAGYLPKPEPEVYKRLVKRHRLDPLRTVMIEDISRNLEPAAALGMTTVWVRSNNPCPSEGAEGGHVHHVTDDMVAWLEEVGR